MALLKFENTYVLDAALVDSVVKILTSDLDERGTATIVVSGGRTPKGFFHLLSQQALDWENVTVTLADERWVNPDHEASNEKLVRENLLINEACTAHFLPLKNAADTAAEGVAELHSKLVGAGAFSVLILGMGDDGHTASLFPGSTTLAAGLDMKSGNTCLSVQPLEAPHERMSMTLPRLLNSRKIILHLSGDNKLDVLNQALNGDDIEELPVRAVLSQSLAPVDIYWAK
jgi:6-phosphogluconolactonase